jgi:hypothetical protein
MKNGSRFAISLPGSQSHIRGLEALNKMPDSYGDQLVCILLDKFSAELRRNLARQNAAAEWDLDTLRKSMLTEIEILEDSESYLTHPSLIKSFSVKSLNVMFTGATSSKESKKRETTPARKLYCAFCDGEHWPTYCTIVKTVDQRYEVAKTKRLCFNCLRKCHAAGTECPSSFRCRECHRPHHTSLHKPPLFNHWCHYPLLVSSDFRGTHNHQSQKTRAFCFFGNCCRYSQSQFLKRSTNLLIDKGAQRTFITLDLFKQLKLKPIRRESLVLIGFTSCRGVSDFYDVVQLSLIDRQGSPILIETIAIPHIVDPLSDPYRKYLLKLPHLKNLLLAHPGKGTKCRKI